MKPVKKSLFSKREIKDLLKAWVAISFAFGVVIGGSFSFSAKFLNNFIVAALTVGIAFLVHELSHRTVARHYGCWAEFRSFDFMLLLAILMSLLFKFVLAAPGAVMISGPVGVRRNGKISAAGPGSNLVLALIFLLLSFTLNLSGLGAAIIKYGFVINTWLALFNMIPFGMFDGVKILRWNKVVYGLMAAVAILLLVL